LQIVHTLFGSYQHPNTAKNAAQSCNSSRQATGVVRGKLSSIRRTETGQTFFNLAFSHASTDFRVAVGELVIHMPVIAFAARDAWGTAAPGKRVSTPGDENAFGQLDRGRCL